jgi:uncharacterized protein YegP (UPF0339 family)
MAKVHSVNVYKGVNDNWYWRARGRNGEVISTSGEGYERKSHALDMAGALFPGVEVKVIETNTDA